MHAVRRQFGFFLTTVALDRKMEFPSSRLLQYSLVSEYTPSMPATGISPGQSVQWQWPRASHRLSQSHR